MISKVQKWGNSQGLRLPKQVLELANIAVGDDVEVIVGEQQIIVKKVTRPKYKLDDLVKLIPKGYKAREEDFGPPVGKEEW
ncbi:MAG: AbrB/MazE/SpoVT family DNA-binding domain-containing protein [Pyrinomonadaceae bacterium]